LDVAEKGHLISEHHSLPLVVIAQAYVADKHRDQRRKDAETSPANHPIALAKCPNQTLISAMRS
jgi:guanosine-3',5'-bis(diphosphate) 3'-pyrophosphohydrolase